MSFSENCRLCFKKLTAENTAELEENKLNSLVSKVLPSINLNLTNSVQICDGCYQTATFATRFQDFIRFKRRYYKEVRQLKLTKNMCRICFKDYPKDSKKLLYKINDGSFFFNYAKHFVELALFQTKITEDAVFCKFCWSNAHKIYDFKKKCLKTEEMLSTKIKPKTLNMGTSTNDVEAYLGDIEAPQPLESLVRSANAKEMTSQYEFNVDAIKESSKTIFETSEEVIETTVIVCENSDSDDDSLREESQDSDVDDIFDETCVSNGTAFNTNGNYMVSNRFNGFLQNILKTESKSAGVETKTYEIENRMEIKQDMDINYDHLSDEDIDDIFSEEECRIVEPLESEKDVSKDDDFDDVFEENNDNACLHLIEKPQNRIFNIVVNGIAQQTTQKSVSGVSFQHTENTVQIATNITKTSDNLFGGNTILASGVKRTLDLSSYFQIGQCVEKSLKQVESDTIQVATEDNLSAKLSNSRSSCESDCQGHNRSTDVLEMCQKHQRSDKNYLGKPVHVSKINNKKLTKKKYKLPPLIPILRKIKSEPKIEVKSPKSDTSETLSAESEDANTTLGNKSMTEEEKCQNLIEDTNPTPSGNKQSSSKEIKIPLDIITNYHQKDRDPESNRLYFNNQKEVNVQIETSYYQQQDQNQYVNAYYEPNNARCPPQRFFSPCPLGGIEWCCHVCMAKFGQREDLLRHFTHHRDPNFHWFHCKKCRFVTTSLYSVHNHLKYCKMEEDMFENRSRQRYVCHLCLLYFSEQLALHNHLQQQHERMNNWQHHATPNVY